MRASSSVYEDTGFPPARDDKESLFRLSRTDRRPYGGAVGRIGRKRRRDVPVAIEIVQDRVLEARGLGILDVAFGRDDALEHQEQAVDEVELGDFLAAVFGHDCDSAAIFGELGAI